MPAFGFQLTGRQPPVHPAAGRPIPRGVAGFVNQFREQPGAGVCGEYIQRGEIRHERTRGVDQLPKARGGVLDLLAEIDRLVRILLPLHPRRDVGFPPRLIIPALRCGAQPGVVTPCEVRLD